MAKIKLLRIKNFLGIDELELGAGKVNIISGPTGSGKSSIVEGLEKLFTNKNRRTEVIKHGETEASLFVELDNGLEIDRKLRTDKSPYLKCRKENEGVPSTEAYIRKLIRGDIFRPIDWVNQDIKTQTKSILGMLEIGWTKENIISWFGELPSNIDYEQHILQILKSIENKYFKDREEVNRNITELKTQVKVIVDELPVGYDGEVWRDKNLQELYNKVSEAQRINGFIEQAKALQEHYEDKLKAIESDKENEINKTKLKFREQAQDIKDIIELSKTKIEKAKETINGVDVTYKTGLKSIELDNQKAKSDLEIELQTKIQELKAEYAERSLLVDKKSNEDKEKLKKQLEVTKEESKDIISIHESKIAAKEQELLSIDTLEEQEIKAIEEKAVHSIELEKERSGKASEYLEQHEPVDVEPLEFEANKVAEMQSYLREWDRMLNIRDGILADKERYSADLTAKITKARELPQELLKKAKMPIEGISVDSDGLIRIKGVLIDGLSDGEKLKLAMTIARAQAGELKLICLDRFESLNPQAQEELKEEMKKDEFQYFVTSTNSDEFTIEVIE